MFGLPLKQRRQTVVLNVAGPSLRPSNKTKGISATLIQRQASSVAAQRVSTPSPEGLGASVIPLRRRCRRRSGSVSPPASWWLTASMPRCSPMRLRATPIGVSIALPKQDKVILAVQGDNHSGRAVWLEVKWVAVAPREAGAWHYGSVSGRIRPGMARHPGGVHVGCPVLAQPRLHRTVRGLPVSPIMRPQ
jgi:hypothetical protein